MLPPSFIGGGGGDMVYNFYSPIKGKVASFNNRGGGEETRLMQDDDKTKVVGSSHGWLALYNSGDGGMCLLNPLSGRRISLPALSGPLAEEMPSKVILTRHPDSDGGCRAAMILGPRVHDRVATCRPGASGEWAPLDSWWGTLPVAFPLLAAAFGDRRLYSDLVYSAARRRLYTVVVSGLAMRADLEAWDVDGDGPPRMDRLLQRFRKDDFSPDYVPDYSNEKVDKLAGYLVYKEESDQLFFAVRYANGEATVGLEVYRINIDEGGLELCPNFLDDLAMFVGINHSFAVKASQFPKLKPNSIYYSDSRNPWVDDNGETFQSIEVFDYENKTCSPLYYPSRHLKNTTPMPWFTPTSDEKDENDAKDDEEYEIIARRLRLRLGCW